MRKLLIVLLVSVGVGQITFAQNYYEEVQDSVPPAKRLYVGGNLSLNIFGESRFIDVSPLIGYRFTPQISAGIGASYLYIQREFRFSNQPNFTVSSSLYGGRVFGRYRVNAMYFAHTEFESINVELGTGTGSETIREWVPGFFIGGGVVTPFFSNAAINITVLYNLIHDNFRSPYGSAIVVRGGIVL